MDRGTLAAMASHILAKIRGDPSPTSVELAFDAAAVSLVHLGLESLESTEPPRDFLQLPQDSRLAHYSSVCVQALQKHKFPLTAVASAGAKALNLSKELTAAFEHKIAEHDWSKLLLPPGFCGNDKQMVPGWGKPLVDFRKKRACPFFDNMFIGVQLHRLLEPTHHQCIVKKTTGALRTLVEAHLRASMVMCPMKLTCLEIVCDTVEASLSYRCSNPEKRQQTDSEKENPWITFAAANFMEGQRQEIPEPYLHGVLSSLFPQHAPHRTVVLPDGTVAREAATSPDDEVTVDLLASLMRVRQTEFACRSEENSSAIMNQVRGSTTETVRKVSVVFDAIYTAYDAAAADK